MRNDNSGDVNNPPGTHVAVGAKCVYKYRGRFGVRLGVEGEVGAPRRQKPKIDMAVIRCNAAAANAISGGKPTQPRTEEFFHNCEAAFFFLLLCLACKLLVLSDWV